MATNLQRYNQQSQIHNYTSCYKFSLPNCRGMTISVGGADDSASASASTCSSLSLSYSFSPATPMAVARACHLLADANQILLHQSRVQPSSEQPTRGRAELVLVPRSSERERAWALGGWPAGAGTPCGSSDLAGVRRTAETHDAEANRTGGAYNGIGN